MTSQAPSSGLPDTIDPERRRAGKEASIFLVQLTEAPGDEALKQRIREWCARSTVNRDVWNRTQRTYEMMGGSPARYEADWKPRPEAVAPMASAETIPFPRARWISKSRIAAAAAMAIAAAFAFLAVPPALIRLQADVMTSTAEVRSLDLEDGSRVFLGPRSAAKIDYLQGSRGVRLLQGEAYFEVVPNQERPFRVTAKDVVTTVLGTEFEVGLSDEGVTVGVKGGRVRVDDMHLTPPMSEQLTAGDWLRVSSTRGADRRKRESGDVADWTEGKFVARNVPIGDIVERLRGYHSGSIILGDRAFANRLVSGVYDLRNPESTLRNLAQAHDAVVREVTPWLLLVTSR